jgi:hypothetical protein
LSLLYLVVSYTGVIREVDIRRKGSFNICYEAGVYGCCVEERWGQSPHYACITLLSVWINENRGCPTTELLVCLSKAWYVLWSDLYILQNDPPSSTQMDGPRVKCVERALCSMTVLVRCFLRQSVVICCRVLPKEENEFENPSPASCLRSTFSYPCHIS